MSSEMTFTEALRGALREEMLRDENVFLIGEDIGEYGGVFKVTEGLLKEFGPKRVIDTPISESAIVGAAVGAALVGMRPVAEIMFADLLTIAMDQIVNSAAKMRYLYGGKATVPLVIRASHGIWPGLGMHHSQSPEGWFINIPGLKVVMPSTPVDAKGLLKSSIRDDNPVLFLEHKALYFTKGPVPEGEGTIPLGKADIKKEGEDVTVVATGAMVYEVLAAAEILDQEGIGVEVVDPRTLLPLDKETILNSMKKTERLVIVEEACKTGGVGSEIAALVAEEAFDYLNAPIKRVAVPNTPIPASPILVNFLIPNRNKIIAAVHDVCR